MILCSSGQEYPRNIFNSIFVILYNLGQKQQQDSVAQCILKEKNVLAQPAFHFPRYTLQNFLCTSEQVTAVRSAEILQQCLEFANPKNRAAGSLHKIIEKTNHINNEIADVQAYTEVCTQNRQFHADSTTEDLEILPCLLLHQSSTRMSKGVGEGFTSISSFPKEKGWGQLRKGASKSSDEL